MLFGRARARWVSKLGIPCAASTRKKCFVKIDQRSAEKWLLTKSRARVPGAPLHEPLRSSRLANLQDDLAVILAFLHQRIRGTRIREWEHFPDHGLQFAGGQPLGQALPC